eukprot:2131035-Lingulodinium_polyedra.AAC.1
MLAASEVRAMRGLLSLTVPEPYPFGADSVDVDFITSQSSGKKPTFANCKIIEARVVRSVSRCLNKNEEWQARTNMYLKVSGAEATKGRKLLDLISNFEALAGKLSEC